MSVDGLAARIEALCVEAEALHQRVIHEYGIDMIGQAIVPVAVVRRALMHDATDVLAPDRPFDPQPVLADQGESSDE